MQAAFVRGLEHAGEIRDEERAVAWFYRLLRNALTDHWRARAAEGRRLLPLGFEEGEEPGFEPQIEAEREAELCRCFEALLPTLRSEYAEMLRRVDLEGARPVAMAGDGINDAPALALAQIGIAMGTGTDIAIANAAVTLVKGDLRGIVRALRLSRATMANIRQNLVWAFGYNALGVPVAAGLLYPFTGWLLSPMLAAAAMCLSSVSVIANALRLRRARI